MNAVELSIVLTRAIPPSLLPLGRLPFRLQSALDRSPGRSSLLAGTLGDEHRQDQLAELFVAISYIPRLVPMTIARYYDFTELIDALWIPIAKTRFHSLRQAWTVGNTPAQHRLAVDFINVLTSRTSTARER